MKRKEDKKKIAIALHTRRIQLGHSVTGVALEAGVNRTTYQQYEAGNAEPPLSVGIRICLFLGLNPLEILR